MYTMQDAVMAGNHEHTQSPRNLLSLSEPVLEQRFHENVNPSLSLSIKLQTEVKQFYDDVQIREMLKNRKGRWLPEEEEYAKFLVEEFESGLSSDLEHGSSLRAYLSKRLFCSPMRISKKFSGKKVGTQAFMRKSNVLSNSLRLYESQMRQRSLVLEHKFLKAYIAWESDRINNNKQNQKQNVYTEEPPKSEDKIPPKVPPCTPNFTTAMNRGNFIGPFLKTEWSSTKHHEQAVSSNSLPRDTGICVSGHQQKRVAVHQNLSYQAKRHVPKPSVSFQERPMLYSSSVFRSMVVQTTPIPRHFETPRDIGDAKKESTFPEDSDIPDLLSGFDQHASAAKPSSIEALQRVLESRPMCTTWPKDSNFFAGACGHESPYITSKSFDEMHQFLGKGISSSSISSLDLNAFSSDNKKPDKSSLDTASAASIQVASFGCEHPSAASNLVSFPRSNQAVIENSNSLQRMDVSSHYCPQTTHAMIQPCNPTVNSSGLGIGGGAVRQDWKTSRHSHTHFPLLVVEGTGSMATYQPYYAQECDGKRKRLQYDDISTFFGDHQSQDSSVAKRTMAGLSSPHYSHAVSASEHSSDAGFDSDPPASYS